jgi:hypothetical protein
MVFCIFISLQKMDIEMKFQGKLNLYRKTKLILNYNGNLIKILWRWGNKLGV